MSQIYLSGLVIILTQVLPLLGINLPGEGITQFAQTLIAIFLGAWIMIRRHQEGDIKLSGIRRYR